MLQAMSKVALREALVALVHARRHEWPLGSFEQVLEGLRSSCRETRSLALQLAGRDVFDAVAQELIALIGGRAVDHAERVAALEAIAGMIARGAAFDFDIPCNPSAASRARFEELFYALRTIFFSPDEPLSLRLRVLDIGSRAATPWAHSAARAAWATDSPPWRRAAARAFTWLPCEEGQLWEAVQDPDPVVRILGWQAAAPRGLRAFGAASLRCALDDAFPVEERAAALLAVGKLTPEGAMDALNAAREALGDRGLGPAVSEALAELAWTSDL